jgi:hypothetical protein
MKNSATAVPHTKSAPFPGLVAGFFAKQGLSLSGDFPVLVGSKDRVGRGHRFDFGSEKPAVVVECMSHTWTADGNWPTGKISAWNEAMYYFSLVPKSYRKIFAVAESMKGKESLADTYVRKCGHLIPADVEVWVFDANGTGKQLHIAAA